MPLLKIIKGPETGRETQVTRSGFSLGRGKNVDLCIADPSVSRLHATILIEGESHFIQDNQSNNGVLLNEKKVEKAPLSHNDLISIGNTTLQFLLEPRKQDKSSVIITQGQNNSIDMDKSIMMDAAEFESFKRQLTGDDSTMHAPPSEKNVQKMQAMLRISNAVANIFDLNELIHELLNIIFDETGSTRGFIMLYDEDKKLIPMAVKKKEKDDGAITVSNTIINTVVTQKKALLSSDLLNDDRFITGMSIIANQIRSCMCVPLLYHNEVLGVIHIDSDMTTSIFSQDDLELLMALSNQAAMCIKNAYLVKKITEEENKRSRLSQYFPPAQVEMLMKGSVAVSLGGKKENVTIIFCDIRSFTSLSEGMEAIDVMNFLNEFFSVMTGIIFSHDGMVDNFMGDCIMAVFGGPFHHENDPERAVRAAIEMQKAQRELNKRFEAEGRKTFSIGIGIHSGDVSRGNIGSPQLKKYTVIGSNVNVCSRLCSCAKAGEILVSATTASRLPKDIELNQLDPVKVKNVTDPLIPFKVVY